MSAGPVRFARRAWVLRVALALTALAITGAAPAAEDPPAESRGMSQTDIRQVLFGTTIEGAYWHGAPFTEELRRDGTSHYRDDRGASTGTLHFDGDALCFAYRDSIMNGGCFLVWQRTANCYDFYAFADGVLATASELAIGIGWTARVWRQDAPAGCPLTPLS
ncbi:MAG: hypothetical protein AcusKO_26680 [Acuticoccus sp.]